MLALLTAAHLGISEVCSNAYVSRHAGSSHADVLEIYGGDANTSIIAAKQGFGLWNLLTSFTITIYENLKTAVLFLT